MEPADLVVVGAGISGLSLAWRAAREGKKVLLLERTARLGGCIHSELSPQGYWFELGAHTAYNSYGAFLDIVEGSGLKDQLIPRGPARTKFGFLNQGNYRWLTPPKVLLQLNWLEAASRLPFGIFRSKHGRTMAEHFSSLVGPKNYQRVLAPFLAAVPSQSADELPAEGPGSLFKTRPRRKDVLRSFGFEGGLQRVCEAAARMPGISIERDVAARAVIQTGAGFRIPLEDGRTLESRRVAIAAPHEVASGLVRESFPALATALSAIETVSIDSVGVVLARETAWMPACAFVVPAQDFFFSCVTRDPFPDEKYRAFTFHFRAGLSREARLARVCEVLRVEESAFLYRVEKRVTLPAPKRDHAARVAEIDRALSGSSLGLTGNYFNGLAIEDCVLRSNAEWQRLSGAISSLHT